MDYLISVIIPVFNADKKTFLSVLNCVRNQQREDFPIEKIIVFDGDPSFEIHRIIADFSDFCFITIEHSGVSVARNEGIKRATGKYLVFVDADDELPEHALSNLFTYAERYSCDVVQGAYDAVLSSSVEHHCYREEDKVFSHDSLKQFQRDVLCPDRGLGLAWGKLFRRTFILDNGIFFDIEMAVSEDTAFALDACSRAQVIGYIPNVVYRYIRNDSSTVSAYRPDYENRILDSIRHMREHVEQVPNSAMYEKIFSSYILFHLLLVQLHYLFNPSAPWSGKQRRELYEETLDRETFRVALQNSNYKDFSFAKRISLYALRFHAYQCSRFISFVRRLQISR